MHYVAGYHLRLHQHGILIVAIQQVSIHKTRTNIGKADVYSLHVCQLCQSLYVSILKTLGGRISRCRPQPLGTGNGTDDGNMTAAGGRFAFMTGVVRAVEPVTKVRLYNENSKKVIEEFVPVEDESLMEKLIAIVERRFDGEEVGDDPDEEI